MNREEHQKRVVEEKSELDQKLGKLTMFIGGDIFDKLPPEEQFALRFQRCAMREYSAILAERINRF